MSAPQPRLLNHTPSSLDLVISSNDAFFDPNSYNQQLTFDEPDNENNMLRDADGAIKGASFAKIITKMVDPQHFGTLRTVPKSSVAGAIRRVFVYACCLTFLCRFSCFFACVDALFN